MLFKVTKQFVGARELPEQEFLKRNEAEDFIQKRLGEDAYYKLQTTYRLYDDLDMLLKEYKTVEFMQSGGSSSSDSGSGAGKSSSFNPTPFNTAPRPTGMPHDWVKDDDEEGSKK